MSQTTLEILLSIKNQTAGVLGQVKTQFDALKGSVDGASGSAGKNAAQFKEADKSLADTNLNVSKLVTGFQGLIAAIGGLVFLDKLKGLAEVAGRAQVLRTVLGEVGKASGYTSGEIDQLDKSVQKMGITASSSRESLTKMIQSGLDVTKASELARSAQNFAVIAGENSSYTFSRLITNVQQMDVIGLKFMGIMVNMTEVSNNYAVAIGKNADSLTNAEKQQALMNEVIKQGSTMGPVYAAALGDVSKAIQSLSRYEEEYAGVLGALLLPAQKAIVDVYTVFLQQAKAVAETYDMTGQKSKSFADIVRGLAQTVADSVLWLLKHTDAMTNLLTVLGGFTLLTTVALAWQFFGGAVMSALGAVLSVSKGLLFLSQLAYGLIAGGITAIGTSIGLAFSLSGVGTIVALVAVLGGLAYATYKWVTAGNEAKNVTEAQKEAMKELTAVSMESIQLAQAKKDAENALVAAYKSGDAERVTSAEKTLKALGDREKELADLKEKYQKQAKGGPVQSSEDVAQEKVQAELAQSKKEWDALRASIIEAKVALDIPLGLATSQQGQVISKGFGELVGQLSLVEKEFQKIRDSGGDVSNSVRELQLGFAKLAESAKGPDEVTYAMDQIRAAAKGAKIDVSRLLEEMGRSIEPLALQKATKATENYAKVVEKSKKILEDLQSLSASESKAAVDQWAVLLNSGSSSLQGLAYVRDVGVSAWGAVTAGAELYRDATMKASAIAIEGITRTREQALTAFNIEQRQTDASAAKKKQAALDPGLVQSALSRISAIIAIEKEADTQRFASAKAYYTKLATLREEVLNQIKTHQDRIKGIDTEVFELGKSHEEQMRLFRQKGMTEQQVAQDNLNRINQLAVEEDAALQNGQLELAKKLNDERKKLVDSAASSVNYADPTARMQVEQQLNGVYISRNKILEAQRGESVKALSDSEKLATTIKDTIEGLTGAMRGLADSLLQGIKLELGEGEAAKLVQDVQKALDNNVFHISIDAVGGGGSGTRGYSGGGEVHGPGTGTSDSIPAWLSAKEFVTRAKAVAYYGAGVFHKMNNMQLPREALHFASGGLVPMPSLMSSGPSGGTQSGMMEQSLNLNFNGRPVGSVRGSRATVNNLVSALKEIERGIL
jgi:hypothetical protein